MILKQNKINIKWILLINNNCYVCDACVICVKYKKKKYQKIYLVINVSFFISDENEDCPVFLYLYGISTLLRLRFW